MENIRVEEAKKHAQNLKEKGMLKVDINVRFIALPSRQALVLM